MKKFLGKKEMGMYDSGNGKTVTAYKRVDATEICPNSKQIIIKYADVTKGKIAQINNFYEAGVDLGSCLHYHINFMTPEELASDGVFKRTANVLGVPPIDFANFIYSNQ